MSSKVAVITGGASGLGLATAHRLASEGIAVALWDRNPAALAAACSDLAGHAQVMAIEVDVAVPASVAAAEQATVAGLGAPAILVAAAAAPGPIEPFDTYPQQDWDDVIAVTLTGVHRTCQAVVPHMVARGWGRVVVVSSVAGKEGNPMQCAYVAAKAGLLGYVKCLGKELAQTGVLVNAITPTTFATPMLRAVAEHDGGLMKRMQEKIPLGRLGRPDEFAEMAAWLCSEACSFSTGATFDLSGGRTTF